MNETFQTVAAGAIVVAAAAYLIRAGWLTVARRRASACGGCANCATETAAAKPLVSLSIGAKPSATAGEKPDP